MSSTRGRRASTRRPSACSHSSPCSRAGGSSSALLAAQLAIGLAFGRRYCLPCLAYFELVQPRFGEGPVEDSRPPRFANMVGVGVLGGATLAYALGVGHAGRGARPARRRPRPPGRRDRPLCRLRGLPPRRAPARHPLPPPRPGGASGLRNGSERRGRRPVHAPALQRLHEPGAALPSRRPRRGHRRRVAAPGAGTEVWRRARSDRGRGQLVGDGARPPGGMIGSPEATTRLPPAS